jgi:hypothetical protein
MDCCDRDQMVDSNNNVDISFRPHDVPLKN